MYFKLKHYILALVLLSGFFYTQAQTVEYGGLKWFTDFEKAKKTAIKENKNIVILFTGSDWCRPCMALKKEVFPNKIFKEYAQQTVLVLADFPRRKKLPEEQVKTNRKLASQFLRSGGFPTMVGIDPESEEIISTIVGYNFIKHDVQPHVRFIKKIVEINNK